MDKNYNLSDTKPVNVIGKKPDIFVASIESFTSADIKRKSDSDKRKSIMPILSRAFLMAVAFGVFSFSIFAIVKRIADDKYNEGIFSSLRPETNIVSAVSKPEQLLEPNNMYTLLEMLEANGDCPDYLGSNTPQNIENFHEALNSVKAQNPETYGWIFFRGTEKFTENGINYPIMIGENDFYINHNYLGEYAKAGSIFADESLNTIHTANKNVLLYGHCMTNGSMFRPIKLWFDSANKNTLAEDMQIEIYTADGVYVYEIFSAYRSENHTLFTKTTFSDKNDYLTFLKNIAANSQLKKRVSYDANSQITTLVTCTNVKDKPRERYVVHGILKQFIPYD
ncbi:MAG: hypothetical protein A2Y15_06720 [Clostridiales bacterium GWF2_36_10]|nr:MAG: hypothetical protein A2Y15_06720 [Clostridiales bacterium GWF2_36_10]HAN21221.1 hypothetical protein [Clostridiales bacterium]